MTSVKCPSCGQNSSIFLSQSIYEGPFKCSFCKKIFKISMDGPTLKSWQEITEDQLKAMMKKPDADDAADKQREEIEAMKAKFRHF